MTIRNIALFAAVGGLIIATGVLQGWNTALQILNMGLVSAIMALGVNLQWGLAGLLNVGVMGFVALGGLAVVLLAMPPVAEAWAAGGPRLIFALAVGVAAIAGGIALYRRLSAGRARAIGMVVFFLAAFLLFRGLLDPATMAVEAVDPAATGYLGGLGLPVLLAWPVGGALAAGAAWVIGKVALGLRSDYLAIATLGIAEIVIAVLKNEDWLARGVKNVNGIPRPVPYEVDLQGSAAFIETAAGLGADPVTASAIVVKLCYTALILIVLAVLIWLAEKAAHSPWGRMMRAIRDNETAARAMGKDVTARHLQVFVLGSAVCGIAGAMMTTLDGQLTPTSYQPLRFTFLIWVMVIVGGSGNNWGAILGGFLIWFLWVQVEPIGAALMGVITTPMAEGYWLKEHLIRSVAYMRLITMGGLLLLVMRFNPRGLIPGK